MRLRIPRKDHWDQHLKKNVFLLWIIFQNKTSFILLVGIIFVIKFWIWLEFRDEKKLCIFVRRYTYLVLYLDSTQLTVKRSIRLSSSSSDIEFHVNDVTVTGHVGPPVDFEFFRDWFTARSSGSAIYLKIYFHRNIPYHL